MMTFLVLILMVGFSIAAIVLNALRHRLEREDRLQADHLRDPLAASESHPHSEHRHAPESPQPSRASSSSTPVSLRPDARISTPAGMRPNRLRIGNAKLQPIPDANTGRAKA